MSEKKDVSTWRIVLAAILDFITIFMVAGYCVGWLTGGLTEGGFSLNGFPAIIVFAIIILYFWGFAKIFGTRIWQGILKAKR